jgi:hypothetical protein
VTDQHKQRRAADESYLAASLLKGATAQEEDY